MTIIGDRFAHSEVHDLEILATLRHPNLRPLLGITLTPEGTAAQLSLDFD